MNIEDVKTLLRSYIAIRNNRLTNKEFRTSPEYIEYLKGYQDCAVDVIEAIERKEKAEKHIISNSE
mgnify:FL=1